MVEYIINPETGRIIRVGGNTFNQLTWDRYDYINGELVRRETAPPSAPIRYFYNLMTNRRIRAGSRRYLEYIRAGWDIMDDYYLVPPVENVDINRLLATVQEAGQEITQRTQRNNPTTYEELMAVHGERLANLNISLCRECMLPIQLDDGGEHCAECKP
jgi:hypothetical protein